MATFNEKQSQFERKIKMKTKIHINKLMIRFLKLINKGTQLEIVTKVFIILVILVINNQWVTSMNYLK
jgi:hypothetical protein